MHWRLRSLAFKTGTSGSCRFKVELAPRVGSIKLSAYRYLCIGILLFAAIGAFATEQGPAGSRAPPNSTCRVTSCRATDEPKRRARAEAASRRFNAAIQPGLHRLSFRAQRPHASGSLIYRAWNQDVHRDFGVGIRSDPQARSSSAVGIRAGSHVECGEPRCGGAYHGKLSFLAAGVRVRRGPPTLRDAGGTVARNKIPLPGNHLDHSQDFAFTRIEAEPAKNPSFWTLRSQIHHQYQKIGEFYLPESNRTVTDVRLGGRAVLTIRYLDYKVPEQLAKGAGSEP